MILFFSRILVIILLAVPLAADNSFGLEFRGKYTTIMYEDIQHLQLFNNRLNMGRLRYLLRGKNALTVEDEVRNKLDVITYSVCKILDMKPPRLTYSLALLPDRNGVEKMFIKLHGTNQERAGFYHAPNNTVYISIVDSDLRVVAHEVAHVVVKNYFKVSPPVKIHELLAQFAEKHISN